MSKTGKVLVADDHEPTLLGMRDLLEAAHPLARAN